MTPQISLIVPVYDEEENLHPLHQAIQQVLTTYDFEIIYVNDGSKDNTAAILDEIASSDSRAHIIHFVRNYGQTAALTAGFRQAQADVIITLDADLQNDPQDIPYLLEKLQEADVVCGWRKDRKDTYLTRTLPSKIANWLISRLSNVHLHDYGCTLRAYKKEFIQDIPLYGEMHRFIPIYVTWAGAKLIEVPVRHHPRTKGISKYGLLRIPKVLLDLTTLKFLRDFFVTPIYFFGCFGLLMLCFGIISSTIAFGLWMNAGNQLAIIILSVLGPLTAIFGVVEITLGVIAEVLIRMHFESQKKEPYRISHHVHHPKE